MNGSFPPWISANTPQFPSRGLWLSVGIVAAWVATGALWFLDIAAQPPLLLVLAVLLRTYLQTGLFIVAHDAMHGSLLPSSRSWNDRLGRLALWLYACLGWEPCRHNHHRHHRHPSSSRDPDHHDGRSVHPWSWYRRFMATYLRPVQLTSLLACWLAGLLLLSGLTPHPLANLLLFGVLPLWLSSLQLFVFGTYLPHRCGGSDHHHATTLELPSVLSLLACYHFGYHREHHDAPDRPWFALPELHRRITDGAPPAARLALTEASR